MGRNEAKRQKCYFSFSCMVNCHEFGWHCFGWTLYSSDSVLQYTQSNPHLKELALQGVAASLFKLFSSPGCFFSNGIIWYPSTKRPSDCWQYTYQTQRATKPLRSLALPIVNIYYWPLNLPLPVRKGRRNVVSHISSFHSFESGVSDLSYKVS